VPERAAALPEWAVAGRSRPGERVSGDVAVATVVPDGMVVAAVDGLGHGEEAARAARAAASVVEACTSGDPSALVRRCHDALVVTRGASIAVAFISMPARSVSWVGVGSVEGRIVGRGRHITLDARRGLVGRRLPLLRASTLELRRGDTVILATDGVDPRFAESLDVAGRPSDVAERILGAHWKRADDAAVLVLRYLGGQA
jgi:phosphoserine phosphatase RsbX